MRILTSLLFFLTVFSCAKTPEEQADSAKQLAKYYLTKGKCSDAKKALDEVGNQSDDEVYISLYAAAYACRAGYSELNLIEDITNIQSASDQMLGSLTVLSTSNETDPESEDFTDIMSAIDTILESADGAAGRNSKFGAAGGTNLNFQALYLILVELGKFMGYYGNPDDAGVKGAGAASNTCLFSYTQGDPVAYVTGSGLTGSCVSGGAGHADLPGDATDEPTLRRLCHGIYLFNNLRDILANVDVGDDSTFGELSMISDELEGAIVVAEGTPQMGDEITKIKNIITMDECLDLSIYELESWYAVIFETTFP